MKSTAKIGEFMAQDFEDKVLQRVLQDKPEGDQPVKDEGIEEITVTHYKTEDGKTFSCREYAQIHLRDLRVDQLLHDIALNIFHQVKDVDSLARALSKKRGRLQYIFGDCPKSTKATEEDNDVSFSETIALHYSNENSALEDAGKAVERVKERAVNWLMEDHKFDKAGIVVHLGGNIKVELAFTFSDPKKED